MNELFDQQIGPSDGKAKSAAEAKGAQSGATDNSTGVAAAIKRGRKPAFTVDRLLLPKLIHELQQRVELAKPELVMTKALTLPSLLSDDMVWGAVIQMNVKGIADATQVKIIMVRFQQSVKRTQRQAREKSVWILIGVLSGRKP